MRSLWLILFLYIATAPLAAASLGGQWLNYGNGLYKKGDFAGALKAYDTALKAEPANAAFEQARGSALLRLSRKDEAVAAFQRSLSLNPNNPALKTYLDSLQTAAQPAQEEQSDLEEVLESARDALAQRDFGAALGFLDRLQSARPSDPGVLGMRGDALYGLGRMKEAREAYQASLKAEGEQPALRAFVESHLPPEVEDLPGAGSADWLAPLWRSALLPGWGQVHNGQTSKGMAIGALSLGSLVGALAAYSAADSAYGEYKSLANGTSEADFNASWNKVENYATANHVLTLIFYSAYIYGMGDAAANAAPRQPVKVGFSPAGIPRLYAEMRF